MKQEIYYCDLCKKQVEKEKLHIEYHVNVLNSFVDRLVEPKYTGGVVNDNITYEEFLELKRLGIPAEVIV